MPRFIYVPRAGIGSPLIGHDMLIVTHGIPDFHHNVIYFDDTDHNRTAACIKLNKFFTPQQSSQQLYNDIVISLLDKFFRAKQLYQEKHVALPLGEDYYEFLYGKEGQRPSKQNEEENAFLNAFNEAGVDMLDDSTTGVTDCYHNFIFLQDNSWGRIDNPFITLEKFVVFFEKYNAQLKQLLLSEEFVFLETFKNYFASKSPEMQANHAATLKTSASAILKLFIREVLAFQTETKRNYASTHLDYLEETFVNSPTDNALTDLQNFETACRTHYDYHREKVHTFLLATKQHNTGETTEYPAEHGYVEARDEGIWTLHNFFQDFMTTTTPILLKESLENLVQKNLLTKEKAQLIFEQCNEKKLHIKKTELQKKTNKKLAQIFRDPSIENALREQRITIDDILKNSEKSIPELIALHDSPENATETKSTPSR